jgi:hypothetical protein
MFVKGETVYRIHSWDGKGTFFVEPCIVHSCGKKRMVLYSIDRSRCVGTDFRPVEEQQGRGTIVRCADRVEAEVRALKLASEWIPAEIKRREETLAHHSDSGLASPAYTRKMNEHIAELKSATPAVIWR